MERTPNKYYSIPRNGDLRTRFDASFIPEPTTGCWLWVGAAESNNHKYQRGTISVAGKNTHAHRVSFQIHHGKIPAGKIVCHKCHVMLCVNPEHLYAGTHKDNTRDMMRAGRHGGGYRPRPHPKPALQIPDGDFALCAKGHAQFPANVYRFPDGRRECRQCRSENRVAWRTRTNYNRRRAAFTA